MGLISGRADYTGNIVSNFWPDWTGRGNARSSVQHQKMHDKIPGRHCNSSRHLAVLESIALVGDIGQDRPKERDSEHPMSN